MEWPRQKPAFHLFRPYLYLVDLHAQFSCTKNIGQGETTHFIKLDLIVWQTPTLPCSSKPARFLSVVYKCLLGVCISTDVSAISRGHCYCCCLCFSVIPARFSGDPIQVQLSMSFGCCYHVLYLVLGRCMAYVCGTHNIDFYLVYFNLFITIIFILVFPII